VTIEYEGEHNDKMRGCYRSQYQSNGKDAYMCVTQFEATDARRALPCFDEPALKASFSVQLTVDSNLHAVSNMPITHTTKEQGGQVTHTFDRTPVMSTYLLAWCVGEFDVIEDTTTDGITIRCFTPVGKAEQGRFALDCAVRILPFYNNFFQHKYPLPKLDMLAIADFAAGAMENWGCVTYRSTALLIDEHNSSAQTRQWVAMCVTHELSHQWFVHTYTHSLHVPACCFAFFASLRVPLLVLLLPGVRLHFPTSPRVSLPFHFPACRCFPTSLCVPHVPVVDHDCC
jgi:puromycin-sensitive aminopeptidase